MKRLHDDPVMDALLGALLPYSALLPRRDDDVVEPAPANQPRPLSQDEE